MPLHIPCFADPSDTAIPIRLIDADAAAAYVEQAGKVVQHWAKVNGWAGQLGKILVFFGQGNVTGVLIGAGTANARARKRFGILANLDDIPDGTYKLEETDKIRATEFALGWALSNYRFNRYMKQTTPKSHLVCPDGVNALALEAIAQGEALTRDLINTPPNDMGPAELEKATRTLADTYGANVNVVTGDALLAENLPMIHAVGRASDRAPRLIDMTWGASGPKLTLVGKGVCFDTGGLNIKPGANMGLMKKDMGGAAHVLGLAHMIMSTGMPIRLRVLIPAVENAINGDAFRPQDILTSRKGLTVEINNTDAEGRLVLADALALADETPPDLMICMATLTGAARVAVGPDIAPYFTDDDALSHAIRTAAHTVNDPVWQMPFHAPYETMIEPWIADLDNAPKGGFAGCITAALFLRRFVTDTDRFVHFDCYGWQPSPAPARARGGVGQGTRALFEALPQVLNL